MKIFLGAFFLSVSVGCASGCDSGTAQLLSEVTAASGLDPTWPGWPDGQYRIPEISAGGVALFDYDGDGDLDIYQVCYPPPEAPERPAPNRLYRQESDGKFVAVSDAAGLADHGYGNGVATGDVDGDGDVDVFVANVGADALYLNNGDATFQRHNSPAIAASLGWSSCAAFLDFDRDGALDLFVTRYVLDDPEMVCRLGVNEKRDYCGPGRYRAVPDVLFRNDGAGGFIDASAALGRRLARPGFGVICLDFTGDGWVDIYVANDMQPNQLYVNQQNGAFVDQALATGLAVSGAGKPEAGMGVAAGDVNGDGRLDLFLTHLTEQTNTLYMRAPSGGFLDRSATSGLGVPSLALTGWGCGLVDLDLDGDLDVVTVNGRIMRGPVFPGAACGAFWNDYAEPNQVFFNDGKGSFRETQEQDAVESFTRLVEPTRAMALGDLDGDGDVDLVTTSIGNVLRIFQNGAAGGGNHWLRVRALSGKRDALGAIVTVTAAGRSKVTPVISAHSFQAANDPVAHFGLGGAKRVESIRITWPDGKTETFPGAAADQLITLRQGGGTVNR